MSRKPEPPAKPDKAQSREDRLKAALKANIGRRKTQVRARSGEAEGEAADKDNKS